MIIISVTCYAFLCNALLTHFPFFCYLSYTFGGVAHLARAIAWHAIGKGFKSPHLHFRPLY